MPRGRSDRAESTGSRAGPPTDTGSAAGEDRILALLATYPRVRPPMTPAHESRYALEYKRNRSGAKGFSALEARLESWMHRMVAKGAQKGRVLELGAGTLNHLPYEPLDEVYDVVEPFRALWEDSPSLSRVSTLYSDIREIPGNRRYERVVSIAVLEHVTDLPGLVARSGLLLAEDGRFQAGIPTEGGFLWGLAWHCTTGVAYRLRTGLDYGVLMRHEHINSADEILAITRFFFSDVKVRRFPLNLKHASFYTALDASGPRRERCRLHEEASQGAARERT